MFNVGGGEVLLILLVALIVLGPDKLPGAVRKVGEVAGEIRKVSSGFQAEMRTAMLDAEAASRRTEARDTTGADALEDPSSTPDADAGTDAGDDQATEHGTSEHGTSEHGTPEHRTPNPGNPA